MPVLIVAGLVSSCSSDPTGPKQVWDAGDIRRFLVDSLLSRLADSGTLILPLPEPGAYPQMLPGEAGELSLAAVKIAERTASFRDALTRQHGRPVNFASLVLHPRIYFAVTPYESLPEQFHNGQRNLYGPYYLATFLSGERAVVSVAVSAYGEGRARDGTIVFPNRTPLLTGNEFQLQGIPFKAEYSIPFAPELAIRLVGEATSSRIAEIPVLIRPRVTRAVQFAHWRLRLDRKVKAQVRGSGATRCSDVVYVGLAGKFFLAAESQPQSEVVPDLRGGPALSLEIRRGLPVDFEEAFLTPVPCE
ncbi:MAG TPA: hypothetical protein VHG28_10015 [Longimicrobiaceae bacterium]|nr:hypothetical protein [Longimicrobiaceae bacterium]